MLKKRKKIFEKIPSKIAKSNFESAYLFSSNLEVEAWVLKGVVFSFEGSLGVVIGTSWDTLPLLFMLLSKTKGEFLGWNGGRGSPKKCGNFRFISNSFSQQIFCGGWKALFDYCKSATRLMPLACCVVARCCFHYSSYCQHTQQGDGLP